MQFGSDSSAWMLQEDNESEQWSHACTEQKQENGTNMMNQPFQSPKANLIENAWQIMKIKLK